MMLTDVFQVFSVVCDPSGSGDRSGQLLKIGKTSDMVRSGVYGAGMLIEREGTLG